ncbi:PID-CTERM protein-sorting domain-containing protein [Jejuia pallidilutea]|uniref:Uncharacterized protein n=1 Tax=Jejuia pallidilutea TaxID=504487 RepID=A0A090WD62_9FLAO|nr:hypothetical protein [Jejuia pallidilutea]PQV49537.1 hypothetical protein CLV33_103171 [Jejuia pallidilutea]GAL65457.1 hypothetical protein JCM19301_3917 [Jejuia pallidilutea]GAL88988.1 hypothetical protein JCM19538_1977 [Jejuia pallidilutea]
MMIQNKRILASILFVLISVVCAAQGGGLPPPPQPPPPVGLPIDGGVLVGALVALFYGGKKLLKK